MKVGKPGAITVGLLTGLPLAWIGVFFLGFFALFLTAFRSGESQAHPGGPPILFLVMFAGHFVMMLLVLALLVFYIVHLFKTDLIASDKKALWAVVLFLGNLFAMPVYWFLYIWRPLSGEQHRAPRSNGAV